MKPWKDILLIVVGIAVAVGIAVVVVLLVTRRGGGKSHHQDGPSKYNCNKGNCMIDPNGTYLSLEACAKSCKAPGPSKYNCNKGNCMIDPNGTYLSLEACAKSCKAPGPPSYPYDPTTEVKLRTVNYNIFGRWFNATGYEGQNERLAAIPAAIAAHPKMGKDVDVITIEEAWCPTDSSISNSIMCGNNVSRKVLVTAMEEQGWKYSTAVVNEPGESVTKQQTNGGAMIFSRWPIDATSSYVYNSGSGDDAHAAKGVIYIRITKTNSKGLKQAFNILGTHLQAWSTSAGAAARAGQLTEIMNTYLPAVGIKGDGTEPLIFQGDMNTDYVLYPEEVQSMFRTLNAKLPGWVINTQQRFSSDPSTNFLVGKDGAADQDGCKSAYETQLSGGKGTIPSKPTKKCTSVPKTTKNGNPFEPFFAHSDGTLNVGGDPCTAYCPCCPHEMLDYIMYSKDTKYLQPIHSDFEIIPLKSLKPLTYKWGWCIPGQSGCMANKDLSGDITGSDLSDHYPVVANFTFKPITQTFIPPDGCKIDSDCTDTGFYCECTGRGCTKDGKHVGDGGSGHDDPVNNNCHLRASTDGTCFCRPGDK